MQSVRTDHLRIRALAGDRDEHQISILRSVMSMRENCVPLHVGIVACSAEGAALCYRTVCAEAGALLGAYAHPEISMHTPSLQKYVRCLEAQDLAGVGELMLASARKLAHIGADFLICPDNTIHAALPLIEAALPRPWLHIATVVAHAAAARGYARVGLLGTPWLMQSEVYVSKLAERRILCTIPAAIERHEIGRIIMEELTYGEFKPASIATFQDTVQGLRAAGCEAVILGCTEIPLILNDGNCCLPTLDSARLLARAALQQAIGARS